MRYSVEPRDFIWKVLDFYLLQKTWGSVWAVSLNKRSLSSQKTWQPVLLRLPQRGRTIQKTGEAVDDVVENKVTEKITSVASKITHEDPRKLMAVKTDELGTQHK